MPGEMMNKTSSSNEHVSEYFSKAMEKGRLSHAYLLAGPAGSGKTELCLDFARSVFCGDGAQPGCQCSQCRRIEHGNHAGVTIYGPQEGKSVIDIDTIREVCSRSHYRRDHTFIAIIEGAERMSNPAANALLKTLEEPAGDFIIILTVASTGNLLPTIVSRCHRLYLGARDESSPQHEDAIAPLQRLVQAGWETGDPRKILSEMFPDAENSRERVQAILFLLLEWSRCGLESATVSDLDALTAFQEEILSLRRALDGNVSAELVVEQAVKQAHSVGELLTSQMVR